MVRLTVPDDYERGYVSVAGRKDFSYNNGADVNTDAVDNARGLSVREDEDGRYVGCSKHYADDVAEFLGVDVPESAYSDGENLEDDSQAEPETVTSAIESGVCPWCDDYEGNGVPQHASAAHPEDWAEYSDSK